MLSNRDWKYWGESDPLWAVASKSGKRRSDPDPWTDAEFMESGARDWPRIRSQWEHYGIGKRRVIEIGCGAGRMTAQLLGAFDRVLAIDVSPKMVETARRLLGTDAARVEFALVDAPSIPAAPGSVDGAFSTHVFQHFSNPKAVDAYLSLVHSALSPGGTVCLHFPISGAPRRVRKPRPALLRHAVLSLRRAVGSRGIIEYRVFDPKDVFRRLERAGYVDLQLRVFDLPAGDAHAFFFGRR